MRPIVFRAWDKINNRMIPWGDITDIAHNEKSSKLMQYIFSSDDFELEQFTGIIDKNSTPVYEGDIAEWHGGGTMEKRRGIVKYEEARFIITGYWLGFLDQPDDCFGDGYYTFEIVGNIHHTPDLLNKKHENG